MDIYIMPNRHMLFRPHTMSGGRVITNKGCETGMGSLLLDKGVLYTIFWDCLAEIDRLEKLNEIRKDAFAYATEPRKRKKKKCK